MKLRSIRLQDFRNIARAALEFADDRCFLVGSNGQGKTNLLEAISYISALRAFRPGGSRVLIREGAREAAIAYSFRHETLGETEVMVRIRPSGKSIDLDGSPVRRLGEVIGRFPTVLFSSEDIQLVRGAPSLRRRFVDLHLAGSEPGYLRALQTYHRALENRNRLLKENGSERELAAFEMQMAPSACFLVRSRRRSLEMLGGLAGHFHGSLSDGAEKALVAYQPDFEAEEESGYARMLENQRTRDAQLRSTQRGPHRDDLMLQVAGRDAGIYASEGQQRALVLSLRFAQLRDARARTRIAPLVLADDVLGELDPGRRARFWAAMDGDLQLFASGTVPPPEAGAAPAEGSESWQIFRVETGRFEVEGSREGPR